MPRPNVRHALRDWIALRKRVQKARALLVLADYDGTLVAIVRRPDQARLAARTRTLLQRLSRLRNVRVGVVSGRALGELRRLVGISGLIYVGNHGSEIRGPGIRFMHKNAQRSIRVLRRVARQLEAALRSLKGTLVEPKRLSLSVHWRNVAKHDLQPFRARVDKTMSPWIAACRVRVTHGKCVVEIKPPGDWGKGKAVAMLIRRYAGPHGTAMYLGDDRTDEDAFRAVNRHRGISVFVGKRPAATAARWWLRSAREVEMLIRRVVAAR